MGNAIPDEQGQGQVLLGSKLVTVLVNNTNMEKRLLSKSCLLLRFVEKHVVNVSMFSGWSGIFLAKLTVSAGTACHLR